ncbi:HtaA domain-containing protein [Microbacterium phyllosphaerae]
MLLDTVLTWGFKTSFIRYVERDPHGRIHLDNGATRAGDRFTFPGASSPRGGEELRFAGTVAFVAHYGMLSLRFEDPLISRSGSSASLSVTDTEISTGRRTILALEGSRTSDDVITFESAVLTADGAELFLDSYPAGTPFEVPTVTRAPVRSERVS